MTSGKGPRMNKRFVKSIKNIQYTGSSRSPDAKWLLVASKIWVPVTYWAHWGLTRCGPFDKICLSSFLVPFGGFYRVPNKDTNHIDQLDEKLLGALRNRQEIKVRLVLESSVNFLSMKYKNIIIWSRKALEKWSQRLLPLQKSKNMSSSTNIHLFLQAWIDFQ